MNERREGGEPCRYQDLVWILLQGDWVITKGALKSQKGPSGHTSMMTPTEYSLRVQTIEVPLKHKEGTTFQHLRVPIQLPLPC